MVKRVNSRAGAPLIVSPEVDPADENNAGAETGLEMEQDELQSIIEQLGGVGGSDAMLKVYRFNESREREFCFNARQEDVPTLEERLSDAYNGGRFEVVIYTPSATGAARRKTVALNIAKRSDWRPQSEKEQAAAPDVMQFMREMMDRQNTTLTEIMKASREQVKELAETLKQQPQGSGLDNALDLITKVKTAFGEPTRAAGGVSEVIETLAAVEQIKKIVAGDDDERDGGGGVADVLREGLGFLREAVAESRAKRMAGAPAAGGGAASVDQEENMNLILRKKLSPALFDLCHLAQAGRNPVAYAEVTLDKIPEQYYSQVIDILGDDDAHAVENLIEIEPHVNDYRPWFTQFCAAIRTALATEDLTSGEDGATNSTDHTGSPDARTATGGDRGRSD